MTGAEALSLWTGRMGLRKAKARRCVCWARGTKCESRDLRNPPTQPFCFPPRAAHMSVWGLGEAPDFKALRLLCSQPTIESVNEAVLEEWCARQKIVCWDRPELSWRQPGATTLQVFGYPPALAELVRGDACPACRATGRWDDRSCCGVADLAAWWETRAVAEALMGGEV